MSFLSEKKIFHQKMENKKMFVGDCFFFFKVIKFLNLKTKISGKVKNIINYS